VVLANEPPGTPAVLHRLFLNIDVAAEQMSHMVSNLLELARLTAGRVEIRREPCDLRSLLLQTLSGIEPLAHRRGQQIESDLPELPCIVAADPPRIERALINVLGNAVRYGRVNGNIHVHLACDDWQAVLSVADDGPGVPEAERERIFEQAGSEFQEFGGGHGAGLGLPIARAMVDLHGGRIWCDAAPEGGACFRIILPVEALPPVRPSRVNRQRSRRSFIPETVSTGPARVRYTEITPAPQSADGRSTERAVESEER
jgi:signal transduction histidine kinase